MSIATHAEAPEQGKPAPIDPAHDIDVKKTVWSLVVCTIAVFVIVWLLAHLFAVVIENRYQTVFEQAPTPDLERLREQEAAELQAGEGRLSIEQAIEKYVTK